jgi:DNA-binding transcriptional LysR family regulator
MPVSHLRSLQALEAAIRNGSLVAAASELGISPAAVGQRIKALEDYLGVELILRGRAGLQPSKALDSALPTLTRPSPSSARLRMRWRCSVGMSFTSPARPTSSNYG